MFCEGRGTMKKYFYIGIISLILLISGVFFQDSVSADQKETIRVGVYEMDGFHAYNEYGELEGYGIDYLNVLASINGWKYEYVDSADFTDACNKLEAGEVDLVAPVMMTKERKAKFGYSELSFGTEYTVLLTNQERTDLFYEDYEHFNNMKVAVLHDYPLTDYFIEYMKAHNFSVELVYFDTIYESKEALKNGQVDAIVDTILEYKDEKLLARFSPQPFYFLTNKSDRQFLAKLNTAMVQVQNNYPMLLEELVTSYYPVYEIQYQTREEHEYIENSGTIKVAYNPECRPISFTNKDGKFEGISKAIFEKISEISGLTFEYIELSEEQFTSEYLQTQGIQLITGVEYNTAKIYKDGLLLSRPYLSAEKLIVSRSDFQYKENKSYTIALRRGTESFQNILKNSYPECKIIEYETSEDCFQALYTKQVDALIENEFIVEAFLAKPVYGSMKVISMDGIQEEWCVASMIQGENIYGISEEEATLLIGIINKSLSQIPNDSMDDLIRREALKNQYKSDFWDFLYVYRFTIITFWLGCFFIIIVIIIYIKEKRKREMLLENEAKRNAVQKKRYQTIVECSDDLIYEISLRGEPSLGFDKICRKFGWEPSYDASEIDFEKMTELLHIHPEDEPAFREMMLRNAIGKFDEVEVRLGKANGDYQWCRIYRTLLVDDDDNVVSILGKITDVDDEVKEKMKLEYQSRTDHQTGLLNKHTFEKEAREYIETHQTYDSCFVFIDIDHFKSINDQFGHSIGDQVIKETSKKIQLLFANFDLVGRFGGDEFCIFVKDIPRDTLIDKLRFAVKKLEQEYVYDGNSVKISASIGAAYCKKEKISYKEFLNSADEAVYQAKDNGRNCYIIKDVK